MAPAPVLYFVEFLYEVEVLSVSVSRIDSLSRIDFAVSITRTLLDVA
jgi:hypothetical protein